MTAGGVMVDGRRVALSNLGKVLYPATGFTKADVIDYYARIAPVLLPHLAGRPLTLKRYPNGVEGGHFFEKNCPSHRPPWVRTAPFETGSRGIIHQCVVDDVATLVWVANLASLELHALLARQDDLSRPTYMVFDHDPGPGVGIVDCCRVALRLRGLLKDLGLQCLPKASGGKGLHLYVPLNSDVTFEQTKTLSRALAMQLERDDPAGVTSNMSKARRPGRVFIDWSQNDAHKTTVCIYSLRAREHPTVSTPVTWEEVRRAVKVGDEAALRFDAAQVLRRVKRRGDLFKEALEIRQSLP